MHSNMCLEALGINIRDGCILEHISEHCMLDIVISKLI